jgi:tripartite-type tricarboxylate transporter receptor subunit TctC
MVFLDLPVLLPQVQAGKLKAIAIGGTERAPALKDVPTTAEVGLPQIQAENWYGMVAPRGTPPAVVARLHQAVVDAAGTPEVKEKLGSQGAILIAGKPEEFTAYIQSEIEKWAKVVAAAGIKPGGN